ncbi:type II secretion system protein N [Vibrio rumoiensis]|uniref:Type II secretion system protein N n=1 Tax=Vibrio rumoiensis 1S-45 TaxID=1188252 RepID=A0A1E5E5Z9_9VIBR|nr:type II secretion system protein N [Vibrio rumoiensis]OEF29449.1 general secretion pathway protein GspN [Vibrio rumoiensis 1S-45]
MKGKLWYVIIFVFALLVSLIANIPAAWVYTHVPKQRGVDVQGISGTIWNGSVQQLTAERRSLGAVYWSFRPSQLFMGKAEYKIRFGQGSAIKLNGKGDVGVGFSGLYAKNTVVSLPVSELVKFVPMQVPVELKGQLEVSLNDIQYSEPWCKQAAGSVAWTGAQIASPIGQLEPGPVIADLTCKDHIVDLAGKQNNQQVSSDFKVNLNAQSRYKLEAWFKPGTQFPSSMSKQLTWLGNPDGQGRYQFTFAGKL